MDEDHQRRVLLENAAWVRSLARQLLRNEDLAEDVAQDVLTVALERPPKSLSTAGVRGWLRIVTRHLAFQVLRREGTRKSVEAEAASSEAIHDADDRSDLQQSLAWAVAGLDPIYRDVVVLRFSEDLSPREIARRLGLSGTTVRKRLSRALRRVEQELRRQLPSDETDVRAISSTLLGPRTHATPLCALPFVCLALACLALAGAVIAGLSLRSSNTVTTATVRVADEFGRTLGGLRVYQLDGDEPRELRKDGSGGFAGARPDRGALVVVPGNRVPQAFGAPTAPGTHSLHLDGRAWLKGSLYVEGRPPREPVALTVLVDSASVNLPAVALGEGIIELAGDAIVLRTTTGDRGFFAVGGLRSDEAVHLGLPAGLRMNFRTHGVIREDGSSLSVTPVDEVIWLGACAAGPR